MENPEGIVHEGAMIRGWSDIATFVCTIIPVPPFWLPPAMNFKGRFCGHAVGVCKTRKNLFPLPGGKKPHDV